MKIKVLLILFFAISMFAKAQTPGEITVESSIVCEMCKVTLEKGLAYEKGIKRVLVDVEKNTIYVKFNEDKLTADEVKQLIAGLGYVADEVKPTKEDYNNLHMCCQKPGVID